MSAGHMHVASLVTHKTKSMETEWTMGCSPAAGMCACCKQAPGWEHRRCCGCCRGGDITAPCAQGKARLLSQPERKMPHTRRRLQTAIRCKCPYLLARPAHHHYTSRDVDNAERMDRNPHGTWKCTLPSSAGARNSGRCIDLHEHSKALPRAVIGHGGRMASAMQIHRHPLP